MCSCRNALVQSGFTAERKTYRRDEAAVSDLARGAVDADEIHALVSVLGGDVLDGFGDSFGGRVGREFGNEGGADLVLLEVGLDEVDGGVDLDFLDILLLFEHVFDDFLEALRECFLS